MQNGTTVKTRKAWSKWDMNTLISFRLFIPMKNKLNQLFVTASFPLSLVFWCLVPPRPNQDKFVCYWRRGMSETRVLSCPLRLVSYIIELWPITRGSSEKKRRILEECTNHMTPRSYYRRLLGIDEVDLLLYSVPRVGNEVSLVVQHIETDQV